MRRSRIVFGFAAVCCLASCDEGRLFPDNSGRTEEGRTAVFSAVVSGADTWPSGYTIALAGFAESEDYAVTSRNIAVSADGICAAELTGLPASVAVVELCALDRLRRRVATFASAACAAADDIVRLQVDTVDVSMAAAVQQEVFNPTCAQCHGGAAFAAAGLNLTEGRSFAELVGVASTKAPGTLRVSPGSSDESLLYRILAGNESAAWGYDHSVEVVRQEKLQLIKNWIDHGAQYNYGIQN